MGKGAIKRPWKCYKVFRARLWMKVQWFKVHLKARSRLSLTHLPVQPLSRVKSLNSPRVRVISPVVKEKAYGGKDLLKSLQYVYIKRSINQSIKTLSRPIIFALFSQFFVGFWEHCPRFQPALHPWSPLGDFRLRTP